MALPCVDGGHGVVVGGHDVQTPQCATSARWRRRAAASDGDLGGEGWHVAEDDLVSQVARICTDFEFISDYKFILDKLCLRFSYWNDKNKAAGFGCSSAAATSLLGRTGGSVSQ